MYPWKIVIGVNASTAHDIKSFVPFGLSKFLRHGGFMPGGLIKTPFGYGLGVGTLYSNEEIKQSPELTKSLIASISKYKSKKIALNGVIPSAAIRHGTFPNFDPRFVKGHLVQFLC